jgi:ABC-2 type transport system ATP-binding protein
MITVSETSVRQRTSTLKGRQAVAASRLPELDFSRPEAPCEPLENERGVVVRASSLGKVFTSSFTGRKKWAVRCLNLDVYEGEIFGFLGPNGAGKTTTIKLLLGLLRPTHGWVEVFGASPANPSARQQVGFLPENPSFYDCLKLGEFLRLCASLSGIRGRRDVERRVAESLFISGLVEEEGLQLRKFSKGMLQRAGLAQAMVNNPRLLVLDEPMSGLDPIGRKEFRDAMVRAREEGRTVFFSSHIIADVELICDRVGIISNGQLEKVGPIAELVQKDVKSVEVAVKEASEEVLVQLEPYVEQTVATGDAIVLRLRDPGTATMVVGKLAAHGASIVSVTPHRETLESVFVDHVKRTS